MSATLVFVHGRGQEARDPAELDRKWRAGLAAGLVKGNAPGIDAARSVLPYYGDLLYRITAELARRGERVDLESLPEAGAGPLHPELPADTGAVEREMLADMAVAARPVDHEGLDDVLSWGAARRALTFVARHTRLDQEIIKAHLRDVAVYLTRARDEVLAEVRRQVPADGPIVLVSHSLGTVIARDLLDDAQLRERTALWVTAGSPLGLDAVQRNLLSKGRHNPGVEWLSCYDVNDVVALGHPLHPSWRDPLRDVEVDNGDSPHSIERYLGHSEVAVPIGAALAR
jgi:hypothetical protein